MELDKVTSYIMQMNVIRDGPGRFVEYTTEFISEDVRILLQRKIAEIDLNIRINVLKNNDLYNGGDDVNCRYLYETVVADLLTTAPGVDWKSKKTAENGIVTTSDEWIPFKLELRKMIRGPCPKFSDMRQNVLYFPLNEQFPAVEFFYKTSDGNLIGFQVTRQKGLQKIVQKSAFVEFLRLVGLEDSSKITLYLVPTPSRAVRSSIIFRDPEDRKIDILLPVVRVLKVPPDYVRDDTEAESDEP